MTGKPVKSKKRRVAPVTVRKPGEEPALKAASSFRRQARRKASRGLQLTVDQRRQLFSGGSPRIVVEEDCVLGPGDVYEVPGSTSMWLGIVGIDADRVLHYVPYDDRPRLLRASPHGVDFDAIRRSYDDRGQPMPLIDEGAVVQAAEESGYTSSRGAALSEEPEAISRADHEAMLREEREEREERIRHGLRRVHEAIGAIEEDDDFSSQGSSIRFLKGMAHKLESKLLEEQR